MGVGVWACGIFSEAQRDRISDTNTGCNTGNSNEVLGNNFSKWNSLALKQGAGLVVECLSLKRLKTELDEALGNLLYFLLVAKEGWI